MDSVGDGHVGNTFQVYDQALDFALAHVTFTCEVLVRAGIQIPVQLQIG